MRKRLLKKQLALSLVILALGILRASPAQAVTITANQPVYNVDSVSPFMTYFRNHTEDINAGNGALTVSVTDLHLPGRGGMDLNLTRTYTNNAANLWTMKVSSSTCADCGDTDYTSYCADATHFDNKYAIGVGWRFAFPSVETSPEATYLHMGDGVSYTIDTSGTYVSRLKGYYLKDMFYETTGGSFTYGGNSYTYSTRLKTKDGTSYYFNSGGGLMAIQNRYGDTIFFTYTTFNGKQVIDYITDTVGRVVDLAYTATKVTATCGDKTIEYNLAGLGVGGLHIPGTGIHGPEKYKLESVVYKSIGGAEPGDRTVSYAYTPVDASFNLYYSDYCCTSPCTNKYCNLTGITYLTGAVTSYTYETFTKAIDSSDPSNRGTMTAFRVTDRKDAIGTADNNILAFAYEAYDSVSGKYYNQRQQVIPAWDTSGAKPLTEKYYFNAAGLLEEKRIEGDGFKQVELTTYDGETKMPYSLETRKYDPLGINYDSTFIRYAYDWYRNLQYQTFLYQEGSTNIAMQETFIGYDKTHYHVPEKIVKTMDAQNRVLTENTIDAMGRVTQSVQSVATETTVSPTTITAEAAELSESMTTGQFWTWFVAAKVNRFDLAVYWHTAILWDHAKYKIYYKKYRDQVWVLFRSVDHGAPIYAVGGTDYWTVNLPDSDYYEIKVVCTDTMAKVTAASGTTTVGYQAASGQSSTTAYTYDPTYPANLTVANTGSGQYIVNTEYDITYHAYPKRVYATNVTNPGFGTSETVQVEYGYDFFGRMTSSKDGLGHETTYVHDKLDRVTRETHQVDASFKKVDYYDTTGKVIVTDEDSIASIYYYDKLGRHLSTYGDVDYIPTNGNEVKLGEKVYDSLGRVWQEKDAEGHTTTYNYDPVGRPVKLVYPDSKYQTVSYSDYLRQKTVTDTNSQQTVTVFDRPGNVLSVTNKQVVNGQVTATTTLANYEYNLLGQVTKFTDGNGQITEYTCGLFGVKEEFFKKADGSTSQLSSFKYEYDVLGNVTKKWWKTNSLGGYDRWAGFEYDQVARPIKKTYSWNSSQVLLKYNLASNLVSTRYSHQGYENYSVNTDYAYTNRSFLDTYTQDVNGRASTLNYDTTAAGRVSRLLYPYTGTQIDYAWDAMGRPTKAYQGSTYYLGSASEAGIVYRNTGFIEKMNYGNGIVEQFTPDVRNRIDLLKLYHKNTPSIYLLNLDYTLDGEGNVLAIGADTFTYDSQNRLHTATVDGQSTTYNLDVMGNRTSVVDGSGTKNYTTADHNLLTQAGTTIYTYDSLGNTVTKSGGYEYWYDEENRLRQVLQNGQVIASYWYDAAGMRVRTDEGGTVTYYTYSGINVIQEEDYSTGVRTDFIFAGFNRIAEKKNGVVRYFHGDHLGSSRVVTDQSGGEAARYKYAPFGATISHSGSDVRYKFTGKPQDGTGLYYFGARYYDLEIGRFTTVDPIGSGYNHFVYCANNPLRYVDPTGLYDPDDPDAPANQPNPNSGNGNYEDDDVVITTQQSDDGTIVTVDWKESNELLIVGFDADDGMRFTVNSQGQVIPIDVGANDVMNGELLARACITYISVQLIGVRAWVNLVGPGKAWDFKDTNNPLYNIRFSWNDQTYDAHDYGNISYGCTGFYILPEIVLLGGSMLVHTFSSNGIRNPLQDIEDWGMIHLGTLGY